MTSIRKPDKGWMDMAMNMAGAGAMVAQVIVVWGGSCEKSVESFRVVGA